MPKIGHIGHNRLNRIFIVFLQIMWYYVDKDEFRNTGAKPACFNCNSEDGKVYVRYNGVIMTMCNTCYNSISDSINRAMGEHEEKNNKYAIGTLGAILGALLGSVLWVVIELIGYIASIAGLAISAAAAKGYTLFKGKLTRLTPWIIGLASLAALLIAQFVTLDLTFYKEYRNAGYDISLMDVLRVTFELPFADPEITADFIKNLGLGLVFAVSGVFGTFKRLANVSRTPVGSLERV